MAMRVRPGRSGRVPGLRGCGAGAPARVGRGGAGTIIRRGLQPLLFLCICALSLRNPARSAGRATKWLAVHGIWGAAADG